MSFVQNLVAGSKIMRASLNFLLCWFCFVCVCVRVCGCGGGVIIFIGLLMESIFIFFAWGSLICFNYFIA